MRVLQLLLKTLGPGTALAAGDTTALENDGASLRSTFMFIFACFVAFGQHLSRPRAGRVSAAAKVTPELPRVWGTNLVRPVMAPHNGGKEN